MDFKDIFFTFMISISFIALAQTDQTDLKFEQQILEFIETIQKNIQDMENELNGNTSIALLVGNTGSGKSTIFNILCGAEFQLLKIKGILKLQVKEGTRSCSKMAEGIKSVTQEPVYHLLKAENILLIDFPGFEDTRGNLFNLIPQILMSKIVTKHQVKLMYVVSQPLPNFENRGVILSNFLSYFENQSFNIWETLFVANKFSQDSTKEDYLIDFDRKQLFEITNDTKCLNQTIFLIRNLLENDRFQEIPQIRQQLLDKLKKQKSIIFKSFKIHHVEQLNNYLQVESVRITQPISVLIQQQLLNICMQSQQTRQDLYIGISSFFQNGENLFLAKYQHLYNKLIESVQQQTIKETVLTESFQKIYFFFSEFNESINGYKYCLEHFKQLDETVKLLYNKLNLPNSRILNVVVKSRELKSFIFGSHYYLQIELENCDVYIFEVSGEKGLEYYPTSFNYDYGKVEYRFQPIGHWTFERFKTECQMSARGKFSWCYNNCIHFVNRILDKMYVSYRVNNSAKFFGFFLFPLCVLPFESSS